MNQMRVLFFRKLLLTFFFFYSSTINAYDFEVGGFYFNKLSDSEVEVTYKNSTDRGYSGQITIPEMIKYNGIQYSVTSIGNDAFYYCTELTGSLIIPNTIKKIGAGAFYRCSGITGPFSISNSVISIGEAAFGYCSNMKGSLNIPSSVISIGKNAFYDCEKLTGSLTIPNSVQTIGAGAFSFCSGLTGSLTLSNALTKIEDGVFSNCSGMEGSIIIPESVVHIGKYAFYNCSNITSLTIPEDVGFIGDYCFDGCSFTSVIVLKMTPLDINGTEFSGYSNTTLYVPQGCKSAYQTKSYWNNFKQIIELGGTYSLSIKATGNGSASYNGTIIKKKTSSFTVNEGTFATITFTPDNGHKIKSVKVNNTDVTSSLSNNQYTISSISSNTTVEVVFEVITHTLSITAAGNGYAKYDSTPVRDKTSSFTVNEGSSATITFTSDDGYRIKSVKVNSTDVISSLSNSSYTITSISSDTSVEVEFEFASSGNTLSIKATGNGSASYNNTTIKNNTKTFMVTEGASATITFKPDNGYRIKSVKVNNTDVTSNVANNQYTISSISSDTSVEVEFEFWGYTLSIKATGNGSATYDGTIIKNKTNIFTLIEGTSATITFTPDNGHKIKSVKVNNTDVTSSLSNNQYTISSISSNMTVEVVFEVKTYTLSITATGNGYAKYGGTPVRSNTSSFTVNWGTSANITFTPDSGYRIKSVKVGSTDVTSSVSNNSYTVSRISDNTSVEVEFEAIPPTTYTLSIKATGNGSATYDGTTIKNKTNTFTVNEGASATITFTPDSGYRIKSVKVGSTDVTSSVSNNSYTVSRISDNTSVEVEFEAILPTTYTLSIKATGNGSATYDGTTIKNKTSTFTVTEGSSATITFTPDNGYRIKSVKVNSTDVTSSVSNSKYTISSISGDTSVEVEFEAIPPTTYTLSIKATGNGSATYDGTTIKNKTNTFTVNEGTSATITFTPDNGYRIKSVKVNSTDVTSSVSNSKYTISSISGDTTVEVEFEAIPPTSYTLSITATGNGSVTYDGTAIKNQTKSFTLTEGASASITITPDNGCRIKSVKINNSDVTSSILNNSFTINNISRNTDVEVEFEVIPSTTYTLSITATGNGSATYEGTVIKGNTSSFTVNEGANATITFTPDNGYRIKSVKANNTDVTSSVSNNAYTVSNINSNTTVDVEFEAIPATAYTLSIKTTGNGSVTYDGTSVRGKTSSFTVNGGTSATITLSADNGNRIKSVTVNNTDVTSKVMNNSYTISNISGNTAVEVVFEEIIAELTNDGVYYSVVSDAQQTVIVAGGDFGMTLDVPASFTAKNKEWKVVGVEANILSNPELAAIIWNPEVAFNGIVNNPNLLLYVKDKKYAPDDIQNVVVNGEADVIVLQDAEDGNNFYCPQEFTAKRISYIHRYSMKTGFKTCQGWETIVLPFDVTTILSATGTEIVPYIAWQQGSSSRPFWLYSLNDNGWKTESGIKANMPYIISMPNNDEYDATYNLSGDIQFMSSNVQVLSSDNLSDSKCGNKQLVPNYQNKVASQDLYVLNVNSQWNTNTATETEGSAFIRSLRQVRPFEAYMTIEGGAGARRAIPIFDEDTNGIQTIPWSTDRSDDAIYNLNGQRVNSMTRGIYIQNGKKIFKK